MGVASPSASSGSGAVLGLMRMSPLDKLHIDPIPAFDAGGLSDVRPQPDAQAVSVFADFDQHVWLHSMLKQCRSNCHPDRLQALLTDFQRLRHGCRRFIRTTDELRPCDRVL